MTFKRGGVFAAMIVVGILFVPYVIWKLVDMSKASNMSFEAVLLLLSMPLIPYSIFLILCPSRERTVEMSAEGCTVRFLWYKKFYRWDELQVKRLADYRYCNWGWNRYAKVIEYDEGAEFSPKSVKRREGTSPPSYCVWHPLTYIYVNFQNKASKETGKLSEHICEVDKEFFLAKMAEWGVILEEAPKQ